MVVEWPNVHYECTVPQREHADIVTEGAGECLADRRLAAARRAVKEVAAAEWDAQLLVPVVEKEGEGEGEGEREGGREGARERESERAVRDSR
jgi:hypothetical protein